MTQKRDILHSMLVVSSSAGFDDVLKRSLPAGGFMTVDIKRSVPVALRSLLEKFYDIVVINVSGSDTAPLDFALNVTEDCKNASVLVVVPAEMYEEALERVTDYGVLTLSKPFPKGRMTMVMRYLVAMQDKIHALEEKIQKEQDKLEELRSVTRAKFILIEEKHMSEDAAHRYIGKEAMNHGVSRRRIAERIIEDYE